MEIEGASYLYTLALLAITYGGFAALFMLFRDNLRGAMVAYDAFLIRAVIQKAFIVAFCAMLPPLLAFAEVSHAAAWRLASAGTALLQICWLIAWVARRVKVKGVPTSKLLIANLSLQVLNAIYLLVGASGKVYPA